ncbi:beta-galactosidase GalA [Ferruginibacter sp.]|nr:glycoside hydrolase family 2 protein [Ferruginibacter sp.]
MKRKLIIVIVALIITNNIFSQVKNTSVVREHLLMDFDWRFAFGHPFDTKKDFNTGTGYFSYLTKAAYGDGAAAANFDDRSWRKLNLPHDWAVEQPFDKSGSFSHGFKAIGRNFPNASVGWYRKTFNIDKADEGKQISIAFDGVFRNSIVWINGFYLGAEPSGYTGFEYNISEYLNYGGENVIAVRADATMEEGWFYEGAGIYRHVWLNKTSPLHVATDGSFVTTKVNNNAANVHAQVTIINQFTNNKTVDVQQTIVDATGKTIATENIKNIHFSSYQQKDIAVTIPVADPSLWSLDDPYLYKLITTIVENEKVIDQYQTSFGIRTIHFDANKGFFLNGKNIKIHGTNNHQDHAGVGAAMPDALQEFRIKALKDFGVNAYRCSHNPPTPELLDVCDRLGMLVIDENRLLGVSSTHFSYMKRFMLRDRNHPSIISWSIANEEWGVEGNELGAKLATTLQAFTKSIDTTRAITAAISGGWQKGISNVIDVMGVNYVGQINTDQHHAEFPSQPMWGTEEGTTRATRGIYSDDSVNQWIAAYDKKPYPNFLTIEDGWKHYAARDYLAGMFIWTGFDYRGEPTPFGFPSIGSYFGMMDQCGFAKDNVYYLKSWWTDKTTLHIFPHWNHQGKEGQEINVVAYSNCDAVELFLNKKSLGKKIMEPNSHLQWKVKYTAGTVEAIGYKNGKKIITDKVQTTAEAVAINLATNKNAINANKEDIAMITVDALDKNSLHVPDATDEITFSIHGPGKIIGVGNGNPSSLEADKYIETINVIAIENLKEKSIDNINDSTVTAETYDDKQWQPAFKDDRTKAFGEKVKALVYRGYFTLPEIKSNDAVSFFYNSIGKEQSIYINGKQIAANILQSEKGNTFILNATLLHKGNNCIAITATPLLKNQPWDNVNINPGLFQIVTPAAAYKRKLFSGLVQVIVQATGQVGEIIVTANANGLKRATIKIQTTQAKLRPAVAGN